MKKILFLILISTTGYALMAETQHQYDFLSYENEIIEKNNLISKEQAMDEFYEALISYYPNMDKIELKQMIDSNNVILVENISPEEFRLNSFNVSFFYSVQAKFNDERILSIYSINAETGESLGGILMDATDKSDFISIMDLNEIILYLKKNVTFPENSVLSIKAVYDYSFFQHVTFQNFSGYWKYCVTIENGTFSSPSLPAEVTTFFVSPYVRGYEGKRGEAAPDNEISLSIKHRLYTYNYGETELPLIGAMVRATNHQDKYIGID